MRWALSFDGRVVEIVYTDPTGRYHPSISVYALADGDPVELGWAVDAAGAPLAPVIDLRPAKIAALQAEFRAAWNAPVMSSALGSPHKYPNSEASQINLMRAQAVLLAGAPSVPFECDAGGGPEQKAHTLAQINQVILDAAEAKSGLYGRLDAAIAAVEALGAGATQAELDAIVL